MNNYQTILDKAVNLIIPGNRFIQSKIVEDSIKDVLKNKYGEEWKTKESMFFSNYEMLRKDFRKESYFGDVPYFYLMYYMPLNIPKVQLVLLQLMKKIELPKKISIMDIGCAVGTSMVAIIDLFVLLDNLCALYGEESFFEKIEISSIDGSADNLDVFKENYNSLKCRLSKFASIDKFVVNKPHEMDVSKGNILGKYDIIIMSNVISEVNPYSKRKEIVTNLHPNLNKSGSIIIIEPASKERVKSMNNLKYDICSTINLKSVAPCGTCSECYRCWIYQKCDVANSELISYMDGLYEKKYESKYSDSFYNDRLKWVYCILTKGGQEERCTDLSNLPNAVFTSAKMHVVGGRKNNSYELCDGNGNKGILVGKDTELSYFNFGDSAELDNVIIKKAKKYLIEYSRESYVKNFSNARLAPTIFYKANKLSLAYLLKRFWGFDDFREGQLELIEGVLKGKDILGILPTAAGKSVCYQLPAIMGSGVSLVISPLKSLIKDQIANLKRVGFDFVDFIDSSKSASEKRQTLSRFKAGSLKLLYITPERLQMRDFQNDLKSALENLRIDYFIIDEAHCASEWGHDFRPSYLKLADVAKNIGFSNIIAVTATASPKVKVDILDLFKIREENVIASSTLDRDEISLQVINIPISANKEEYLNRALLNDLPQLLHKKSIHELHEDGSGVIFAIYARPEGKSTKSSGTESIREMVDVLDINANVYHSKLDDIIREETQDKYKQDEIPLLVATKGFGMGIDKPNIRYIIHMCFANSLEAYYQEAGRAGRDRQHAHSIIITRSRVNECIIDKVNDGISEYEPKCINNWCCRHSNNSEPLCDYGMQAKFISESYPDAARMTKDLKTFHQNLSQCSNGNTIFQITKYSSTDQYEKYLFYFQKYGIISNYDVIKYIGDGGKQFGVIVLDNMLEAPNVNSKIDEIVNRIQNFKKQKYNMLESMWEYVDNKTRCRRQFLLDYFQDSTTFGDEGCKFCDIEGISEEKAIRATKSLLVEKIYSRFQELMELNDFEYKELKSLMKLIIQEGQQEGIKIRAMKYLEDYTDNLVALYYRTIIALTYDQDDAYTRTHANDLFSLLLKSEQTGNCVDFANEITGINEELMQNILIKNAELIADLSNADALMNGLHSEGFKELVYKIHIDKRITGFSNRISKVVTSYAGSE